MRPISSGQGYIWTLLVALTVVLANMMNLRLATAAEQWLPTPNGGLNGPIAAIVSIGDDVYVGGRFTATQDGTVQDLNNIAVYRDGVWSPLPHAGLGGIDDEVTSLTVIGKDLYVGGRFAATADGVVTGLNQIARFSNGEWLPLANGGLKGLVNALTVRGQDLYVGGNITATADNSVRNLGGLAKYRDDSWSPLSDRSLAVVETLKWFRGDLYVGGLFHDEDLHGVVKFVDGKSLETFGGGLGGPVFALEVFNNRLIVGGHFETVVKGPKRPLGHIAASDGTSFEPLPNQGLEDSRQSFTSVRALFVQDGVLYVGGYFDRTADGAVKPLASIAKFSANRWSVMPNGGLLRSPVSALGVQGGSLFVGGRFERTEDGAIRDLGNFAEFDLGANLRLTQTVRNGSFDQEFIADLRAVNRGPNTARDVRVSGDVPADYRATNVTTDKGSCAHDSAGFLCSVQRLGNEAEMNIKVTLRAKDDDPVTRTNCAEITSSTYDPNPVNGKACSRIPPR